ncbi:hypothetical protein DB30_03940 [Enhygromyxa salina]|uniref:Uncharacterized protein n=1 Tax=Enhygromyxa salina TaxID=215803 RepID=A0A0C2D150_9BACT|nr:hypothetical protein DB30_03940 [Enhygromyxa salina]
MPDERRARQILATVDEALRKSGHRAVLFDTRDMEAPSESVNAILRWWVDAGRLHDKVALLVKSDLKRIASNMRALSVGVKMRSFHELQEAEVWLRKPLPRVRAASGPAAAAAAAKDAEERPPSPFKGTLNSRGRETGTVAGSKDAGTTSESGPASRWRSPLLRGIGSGDKS